MFEAADLEHRVSKSAYRRQEPKLRRALLEANNNKYYARIKVLTTICEALEAKLD